MAAAGGFSGLIEIAGNNAHLDTWTLDMTMDSYDTTYLGLYDATSIPGLRRATGSCSGTLDLVNTGQTAIRNNFVNTAVAAVAVLRLLHAATSSGFSCTAVINSFSLGVSINDKQTFSAGFTVTGGVGQATT